MQKHEELQVAMDSTIDDALRRINSATFERLASDVARVIDPRYANHIGTGLNTDAKPISDPVDGCVFVGGAKPVALMYTTEANLRRKWLGDAKRSGDTQKAISAIKACQDSFFSGGIVVLVTNRTVSSKLVRDVNNLCSASGLECDIIEFSRLRHFLTATGEGQRIRRKYFGERIDRLTPETYRNACNASLAAFAAHIGGNPDAAVSRPRIEREVEYTNASILVGRSGVGKSIVAYGALRRRIESGGYGVWVPANLLSDFVSLDRLIGSALATATIDIEASCGSDALRMRGADGNGPLVVLDDITTAGSPREIVRHLRRLLESCGSRSTNPLSRQASIADISLILTTTEKSYEAIKHELGEDDRLSTVFVEHFTREESIQAIRTGFSIANMSVNAIEAELIADNLNDDPFLIGTLNYEDPKVALADASSGRTVASYLERISNELAASSSFDRSDFISTCAQIALLNARSGGPKTLRELDERNNQEYPRGMCVRLLAEDARLLIVTDVANIRFRHPRLETAALAMGLAAQLRAGKERDLLRDPFFSEPAGLALLEVADAQIVKHEDVGILALAYAVAYSGESASDVPLIAADRVRSFLQHSSLKSEAYRKMMHDFIAEAMLLSNARLSQSVADVLDNDKWQVRMVLSRWGDVKSAWSLTREANHGYAEHWLDDALLKCKRFSHAGLRAKIDAALNSDDAEEICAAISVAVRASIDISVDKIVQISRQVKSLAVAEAALWALSTREYATSSHFTTIVEHIEERLGPNVEHFRFDLERSRDNKIVDLIDIARQSQDEGSEFSFLFMLIIDGLDHPDAIDHALDVFAMENQAYDDYSKYLKWFLSGNPYRDKTLSKRSVARLRDIWANPDQYFVKRNIAYFAWEKYARRTDLGDLRKVSPQDPMFSWTIAKRMEFGDASVLSALPDTITTLDDSAWVALLPRVWDSESKSLYYRLVTYFIEVTEFWNNSLEHSLAEAAAALSDDYFDEILTRFPKLSKARHFVEVAISRGTPVSLDFAKRALTATPPGDILDHVVWMFARMSSRFGGIRNRIALLEPFLPWFPKYELLQLFLLCRDMDLIEWSRRFVEPLLEENVIRAARPTEQQLLEELHRIAHLEDRLEVDRWLQYLPTRTRHLKLMDVVRSWLQYERCRHAQAFALRIIDEIGTRADVRWALEWEGLAQCPLLDAVELRVYRYRSA